MLTSNFACLLAPKKHQAQIAKIISNLANTAETINNFVGNGYIAYSIICKTPGKKVELNNQSIRLIHILIRKQSVSYHDSNPEPKVPNNITNTPTLLVTSSAKPKRKAGRVTIKMEVRLCLILGVRINHLTDKPSTIINLSIRDLVAE